MSASKLKVITPPTSEPLTLAEVWADRSIDATGSPPSYFEDDILEQLISAAREAAEAFTNCALAPTVFEMGLDGFPAGGIQLPKGPLVSVDSIKYTDTNGDEQTLSAASYVVDDYADPAVVYPEVDLPWPTDVKPSVNVVRVRFTAGYGTGDESPAIAVIPASIKKAMLLILGHLYENREDVSVAILSPIPHGAQSLLMRYRVNMGM